MAIAGYLASADVRIIGVRIKMKSAGKMKKITGRAS